MQSNNWPFYACKILLKCIYNFTQNMAKRKQKQKRNKKV